jgi:hypothetical protein
VLVAMVVPIVMNVIRPMLVALIMRMRMILMTVFGMLFDFHSYSPNPQQVELIPVAKRHTSCKFAAPAGSSASSIARRIADMAVPARFFGRGPGGRALP